jgi:hypothetical protein
MSAPFSPCVHTRLLTRAAPPQYVAPNCARALTAHTHTLAHGRRRRSNNLVELPESFSQLAHLSDADLRLELNPLLNPPVEIAEEGTGAVVQVFACACTSRVRVCGCARVRVGWARGRAHACACACVRARASSRAGTQRAEEPPKHRVCHVRARRTGAPAPLAQQQAHARGPLSARAPSCD